MTKSSETAVRDLDIVLAGTVASFDAFMRRISRFTDLHFANYSECKYWPWLIKKKYDAGILGPRSQIRRFRKRIYD